MADAEKKSWMAHLPGILGGSAALLAALTTVYVNLRSAAHESPAAAAPANAAKADTPATTNALPSKVVLRLDRIRVDNDGSFGTTDWTFEVDADGNPLYSLPVKSLDDREGQNLRMIPAGAPASGTLTLSDAASIAVAIKGWKQGLLHGAGAPDVTGQAWLANGMYTVKVEAKSPAAGKAAFVFYFSVTPVAGARK